MYKATYQELVLLAKIKETKNESKENYDVSQEERKLLDYIKDFNIEKKIDSPVVNILPCQWTLKIDGKNDEYKYTNTKEGHFILAFHRNGDMHIEEPYISYTSFTTSRNFSHCNASWSCASLTGKIEKTLIGDVFYLGKKPIWRLDICWKTSNYTSITVFDKNFIQTRFLCDE
jgi:hypothetical protein